MSLRVSVGLDNRISYFDWDGDFLNRLIYILSATITANLGIVEDERASCRQGKVGFHSNSRSHPSHFHSIRFRDQTRIRCQRIHVVISFHPTLLNRFFLLLKQQKTIIVISFIPINITCFIIVQQLSDAISLCIKKEKSRNKRIKAMTPHWLRSSLVSRRKKERDKTCWDGHFLQCVCVCVSMSRLFSAQKERCSSMLVPYIDLHQAKL